MKENTILDIDEVHKVTIEVLKKLIEICDYLSINYYIAYGSLIGAVRHKGFIPWDDDLDIIMLRDDYELFIKYCIKNKESILPYKILDRRSESEYPYTIARFTDTRYRAEFSNRNDYGCGVFIDIYPFDEISTIDKNKIKKDFRFKIWYELCLAYASQKKFQSVDGNIVKTVFKKMVYLYAKRKGKSYFLDKLDAYQYKYKNSNAKYVACLVWNNATIPVDKSHYQGFTYVCFEGLKVKAPLDYDKVLIASYGDYMKLPPEKKRVPQHEYKLYKR